MPSTVPPLLMTFLNALLAVLAILAQMEVLAASAGLLTGFWAFLGYPSVLRERAALRSARMRAWVLRDLDDHWARLEDRLRGRG